MATKKKATAPRKTDGTEQLTGTFVCGWAEYKPPVKDVVKDAKGRTVKYDVKPGKIITRLMVELEDGSCVPVYGDYFEPIEEPAIKGAFKACFPSKLDEARTIAAEAYKPGDKVKLRKKTFESGNVVFDEIE